MPTDMDMGNKENLKKYYEPFSDTHLEAVIQQVGAGSPEGQAIRQILAERRALPDKQFEKTYNLARIAAVVSVIGAFAAWASVLVQCVQTHTAPNESRQRAASIAPTPSPSP
jgi:hypothetical protein